MFFEFMKCIKEVENGNSRVEYNGLKLTNKNTLIIDLSSISSLTYIFEKENRIIEEYIKYNFENLKFDIQDEEYINNIFKKYINNMFNNLNDEEIEVDYIKILKTCSKIYIKDKNDLINIIKSILKSDTLKEIIIIYKKSILNEFKFYEIEQINDEKIHLFEICDKNSTINYGDNIIIFDKEITQIRVDDFLELILNKTKTFKNLDKETYSYLIAKILFYSIDKKEVDLMKKYNNEISELAKILNDEFKFNLKDLHGYI